MPHGDYPSGILDGWIGIGDQSMVAIGGWIDGSSGARIHLILDGDALNPVDFGGDNGLGGIHRFLGVIEPDGFSTFEWRETEGVPGDQMLLLFADDFYFAFGGATIDCNNNGIGDGADIAGGTSPDCNNNVIPDECEIDANSPAPGGPFFCVSSCAADCNDNGLLDECEVVVAEAHSSGQLTPIGTGSPQTFTIPNAPQTQASVVLDFTAYATLGGPAYISVDVNGVFVGTVFGPAGSDCPETQPDSAQLLVPAATFNDAVAGADAVITMTASAEVLPDECLPFTCITVEATLYVPSNADTDANGVPDECDLAGGIPAVSTWGMIVLSTLILLAGTILVISGRVTWGITKASASLIQ